MTCNAVVVSYQGNGQVLLANGQLVTVSKATVNSESIALDSIKPSYQANSEDFIQCFGVVNQFTYVYARGDVPILCTDTNFAINNPDLCPTIVADPCLDPAFVAANPDACPVAAGDCSDTAWAIANPQTCEASITHLLDATPASLNFGTVNAPGSSTLQVTVTSSGQGPVNSISIYTTGDATFSSNTNCGTTLAAGASCNIDVTYTTSVQGLNNTGVLHITSSASNSPKTVNLSGYSGDLAGTLTKLSTTGVHEGVALGVSTDNRVRLSPFDNPWAVGHTATFMWLAPGLYDWDGTYAHGNSSGGGFSAPNSTWNAWAGRTNIEAVVNGLAYNYAGSSSVSPNSITTCPSSYDLDLHTHELASSQNAVSFGTVCQMRPGSTGSYVSQTYMYHTGAQKVTSLTSQNIPKETGSHFTQVALSSSGDKAFALMGNSISTPAKVAKCDLVAGSCTQLANPLGATDYAQPATRHGGLSDAGLYYYPSGLGSGSPILKVFNTNTNSFGASIPLTGAVIPSSTTCSSWALSVTCVMSVIDASTNSMI